MRLISMLLLLASLTYAQAPFGFRWGMTAQQVKATGCVLIKPTKGENPDLTSYLTHKTPKNFSIAETYMVNISKTYGLQKIIVVCKDFTEDVYGIKGKASYNKYKNALNKKYHPIDSLTFEYSGGSLYKDPDEFYQCLHYPGCGGYYSTYVSDSGTLIQMQLRGVKRGTGYLKFTYETKTWGKIINLFKKKTENTDEGLL